MATEGVRYIKIARIDKNGIDQTNTLQSLNQITIPYTSGDIVYTVINIIEKPTFFLYYVNPAEVDWSDRADIKYDFTGSLTSTFHPAFDPPFSAIIDINAETDNLSFLTDRLVLGNTQFTGSFYKVDTYPQKSLYIRTSGSISITDIGTPPTNYTLTLNRGNTTYPNRAATLDSLTIPSSGFTTQSFDLSFSEPSNNSVQPGDSYYLQIAGGTATILTATTLTSDSKFFITSSDATGLQVGLVPEPYFGSNDFKRALDCQPLLNNVDTNRRHNLYQDVDYSAGINEPTNFDLLISGSALRAEVQLSNYTTRRHVIPRYEGSKSTSQKLNRWSKGDTGTFGKTPTIESLKTVIAYCDWIGGWPPDRMNASTAHVLYLIDADGNIGVPNTSENSLPNVQGAFQTGERFRISSKTIGSGPTEQFRTVIRGGQRIEPILYTQSGSAPNAYWNTTMSFEDIIPSVDGNVGNYQSTSSPPLQNASSNSWNLLTFTYPTLGTIIGTNSIYEVPSGVISDGINLKANFRRTFESSDSTGVGQYELSYRIVKQRGGSYVYYPNEVGETVLLTGFNNLSDTIGLTIDIPVTELATGDNIYVEYFERLVGSGKTLAFPNGAGYFKVTQYPSPTSPITSSGVNSIWNWGDSNNYPYIITSSNPTLIDLYNETAKQTDIPNSGFEPVSIPFSIKYGDEFRFEGREDFTYMVKEIYAPYDSGSRVFQTGSIEVHFNSNLPIDVNSSNFNLDHFLIRRYVDDASQIIFEGFKPLQSQGPFILTPEFSTSELDTNIDNVITNLKERGLITGEEGT